MFILNANFRQQTMSIFFQLVCCIYILKYDREEDFLTKTTQKPTKLDDFYTYFTRDHIFTSIYIKEERYNQVN